MKARIPLILLVVFALVVMPLAQRSSADRPVVLLQRHPHDRRQRHLLRSVGVQQRVPN